MAPSIRIGIGGWTYEPWRGTFYPSGLAQKDELGYASRRLTTIEINGTFYRSQTPATFAKWHDETPEGFVFSLKAPRFATNRRELSQAGESIERFFASGVMELGDKLGVVNWQFMPTKKFDADDVAGFLDLLPGSVAGRPVRHALEVRHDSFRTPEFVALARARRVGIVVAADGDYPQIADPTAPFVYVRVMGTRAGEAAGYPEADLQAWVERARAWCSGGVPADLQTVGGAAADGQPRDVFLYVISGHKAHNPAAAAAMLERLGPQDGRPEGAG